MTSASAMPARAPILIIEDEPSVVAFMQAALERSGYVKVRDGTNGFSCLVDRQTPWNSEPTCFDAEGTRTTLQARIFVEEERAKGKTLAEDHLAALYPGMLAWHRWWIDARDPDGIGLVGMLHPWESGMDNSPCWDAPLASVTTPSIVARSACARSRPGPAPSNKRSAAQGRTFNNSVDSKIFI